MTKGTELFQRSQALRSRAAQFLMTKRILSKSAGQVPESVDARALRKGDIEKPGDSSRQARVRFAWSMSSTSLDSGCNSKTIIDQLA